jgi:hypothetical protein
MRAVGQVNGAFNDSGRGEGEATGRVTLILCQGRERDAGASLSCYSRAGVVRDENE